MLWILGAALLFVGGCAEFEPRPEVVSEQEQVAAIDLVWPSPPDPARIAYVGIIAGSRDLYASKSLFRRLGEVVLGSSDEWLVRPTGVAVEGRLLAVADPGVPALFLFDRGGKQLRKITRADGVELVSPVGVALAPDGRVFLSDSYLRTVFVFDRDGNLRQRWGEGEMSRPSGLAFSAGRGRLYVGDAAAHRVLVYDSEGKLLLSFGEHGARDGQFNWPTHLCLDRDGLLYVVDALNFRVQVFDGDGRFVSVFGHHGDGSGDLARPKGVAVDSRGYVYVVDALFGAVQLFGRQGEFLLGFGRQGVDRGEFWLPVGIAIDAEDEIFVADSYNQRVQTFRVVGGG